jgi:hypothetical protein
MSSCPIPISAVSETARKHVDPKSPPPVRLMAARGMVPMGPRDMITVLVCLNYDEDDKISQSAAKSLAELPDRLLQGGLAEALHPLALDHLARVFSDNDGYLEAILLNKQTADETYAFLADKVSERLLGIIVENQVRILRHPPIAQAILKNPGVLKSTVDNLMDFAVRTGMDFKGLDAFEDAKQRISSAPRDFTEEARIQQVVFESLPEDMLLEEDESEPSSPEEEQEREKKRKNILQRLHTMTPAQKIVLAQKGNKTVRMTLIRDANKIVAVAAIRNPGISESEIIGVATSRAVSDDVIRIICNNREWTRSYAIKLALVQNPKTPVAFSMRFLQVIRSGDLKKLSQSKNIPSALAAAAKKIIQKRGAGR